MAVVVAVELEYSLTAGVTPGPPVWRSSVASVPEFVIRTISKDGTASHTSSAISTSSSVGAPKVVPFRAADSIAPCNPLVRVAENERSVTHNVVHIGVAVYVEDAGTLTALHEYGVAAHRANARTGLFTPPGMLCAARAMSRAERSVASTVRASASVLSLLPCKRLFLPSVQQPRL